MERSKPNFKVFIPAGVVFIGAGVSLLRKSPNTGIALIAVGLSWIAIGYAKTKKKNDETKK
ncbi:MAG TPA: hypothetical protein PLK90_00800 [Clostridiales bacterium]|jgi:uncharacterized membrane protein|nr:hypothetical protein [Clostridiales bacterium]HQP68914.1 hypothetical protein [Clostridiales bacterium]